MCYFLSIGFRNPQLFVNCHSTLFKWLFALCLKFMNVIHYIFYLNLWLKYVVKYYNFLL